MTELNALLTPNAHFTNPPKFSDPSMLGIAPGQSLLTLLSSPLTNRQVKGTRNTVQEVVTAQWLSKRKMGSIEKEIVILGSTDSALSILGHAPSKIAIKYHKPDELDLMISQVQADFPTDSPDQYIEALEILSNQFGAPLKEEKQTAVWKYQDGLTLTLTPASLKLSLERLQDANPPSVKASPSSTPWLK